MHDCLTEADTFVADENPRWSSSKFFNFTLRLSAKRAMELLSHATPSVRLTLTVRYTLTCDPSTQKLTSLTPGLGCAYLKNYGTTNPQQKNQHLSGGGNPVRMSAPLATERAIFLSSKPSGSAETKLRVCRYGAFPRRISLTAVDCSLPGI